MQPRPYNDAMRSRSAFTVVELVVAVGILVILISMLMPSINLIKEGTKRTQCQSQLRQIGQAHGVYAVGNGNQMVQGQPAAPGNGAGTGIHAVWGGTWQVVGDWDRYRGHGALAHMEFIEPELLYCPSWIVPWIQYGQCSAGSGGGAGNGWPLDNDPTGCGTTWIQTSYAYRSSINAPNYRAPSVNIDPPNTPIMADHFSHQAGNRAVMEHHVDGYNVLTLDGAVHFVEDDGYKIRDTAGGNFFVTSTGYAFQEDVWKNDLKR